MNKRFIIFAAVCAAVSVTLVVAASNKKDAPTFDPVADAFEKGHGHETEMLPPEMVPEELREEYVHGDHVHLGLSPKDAERDFGYMAEYGELTIPELEAEHERYFAILVDEFAKWAEPKFDAGEGFDAGVRMVSGDDSVFAGQPALEFPNVSFGRPVTYRMIDETNYLAIRLEEDEDPVLEEMFDRTEWLNWRKTVLTKRMELEALVGTHK